MYPKLHSYFEANMIDEIRSLPINEKAFEKPTSLIPPVRSQPLTGHTPQSIIPAPLISSYTQ